MNLIEKIILIFKKPRVVVLAEKNQEKIKLISAGIVGSCFQVKREVLFVDDAEKTNLSSSECLIYNFDQEGLRKIKEKAPDVKLLSFGFQEGANFQASDLRQNGGTNFKINYQGKIVPIWLIGNLDKEEIYSVLAAAAVGVLLGLNLVEISQALKNLTVVTK